MAADTIKQELQSVHPSPGPRAEGSSIWRRRRGAAPPPADRIKYQTNFGRQPERQRYQVLDLTKADRKIQRVERSNTPTNL